MAPKDHQVPAGSPDGMHQALTQAPSQAAQPAAVQAHAPDAHRGNGELVLPLTVVTRSDISRSLRELVVIDDYFHQAAVRGSKDQAMPPLGRALSSMAEANQLNLLHGDDRARLKQFLTRLKATAPVIHMSFPSEASPSFLVKILEWFRTNTHPHAVLQVGLQPELAAGCTVRTTNKQFDFSFRKRLAQSKQKLIAALEAANKIVEEEMRQEAANPPQPAAAQPAASEQPVSAAPSGGQT